MKLVGVLLLLAASFCFAQDSGDFKPADIQCSGCAVSAVDSNSRVQIRFKAPDATKVRVNFWSGPKARHGEAGGRILDIHHAAHGSGASLLHDQSWTAQK